MLSVVSAVLLTLSLQTPSASYFLTGTVLDQSGAPVTGASVSAVAPDSVVLAGTRTALDGTFTLTVPSVPHRIIITASGFVNQSHLVARVKPQRTFVLEIAGVSESVSVDAPPAYRAEQTTIAMRTSTPLRDTPQVVSVITRALIADQAMQGIGDVVRYMPGVGIAQGEGNRDTPVLRGNATTADFFVDGMRDDLQYVRDLYNVERVEAIKGPNAMVFGRGGAGGIINRATRQANWRSGTEFMLQTGSWDHLRVSGDVGAEVSRTLSARLTGVYQDSESYRAGVGVRRYGTNPTAAFRLGPRTTIRAGYEYFHDERTADRGVSSYEGQPLQTQPSIFFGDPARSPVRATINVGTVSFDHAFARGGSIRNRLSIGAYDKFYQNVFPGAVNAVKETVQISAYNQATDRQNLFSQTDVALPVATAGVRHTFVIGAELGHQTTENLRNTGFFSSVSPTTTTVEAPLSSPTVMTLPIEFRQSATDPDNRGVAITSALYAQDQIALSRRLDVVVGLRFERFQMDFTNNRTGQVLTSRDALWSPRAGVIFRVAQPLTVYGSYTRSYLPRAGEQLSSLTATNHMLDPEGFQNYELGATWDLTHSLAITAAVYRLGRGNVAIVDPADPARTTLVDGQRTRGLEVGWNGFLTTAWSVAGGYALQDGEITRSLSASAQAGAALAQLPIHSFSLWNKYQFHTRFSAGFGVVHRGRVFTSTDNRVSLPGFTRTDGSVAFDISERLRAQMNVENLFDTRYFASAHSNTNITPGSPRAIRATLLIR